ncbi:hypothetical protein [Sphingobacterium composti Ten et al. 2007 non Yoo et al. 2007]|uniref:hypothetical protein n=1 Tax=Sphingobacterium composti TaxID=363260 RepID=UPI001916B8B1|nr:hypothetical protein [Sphingobacterium composti Ten et al. 2007 non Yoo et al. 2007]
MKGKIFISKFWTKVFSIGKADAITIFPFIFLRTPNQKYDKILLNHERIHIAQALELFVIPFYIWYLLEFLIRFLKYRNFDKAYLNICFEREAYANQNDKYYLYNRKLWSFLRYL